MKERIRQLMIRFPTGKRLCDDRHFRTVFFAAVSFGINLLYAFYNGFWGLSTRSVWFVAMCAYYTVLSLLRIYAVRSARREAKALMRWSGGLLLLLALVLTGVLYLSLTQHTASRYSTIPMITIATYTFTKITLYTVRAVRTRGRNTAQTAVIRCIGYAEVAVSLYSMQRSMLVSFEGMSDGDALLMNALTGSGVLLFVAILGVCMWIKGGTSHGKNNR